MFDTGAPEITNPAQVTPAVIQEFIRSLTQDYGVSPQYAGNQFSDGQKLRAWAQATAMGANTITTNLGLLGGLTGETLQGAFDTAFGDSSLSVVQFALNNISDINITTSGRVDQVLTVRKGLSDQFGHNSALASSILNENFCNRIWVSPFYSYQKQDSKDGYAPYKYTAGGVALGYDRAFGSLILGGAFIYSRGDYDDKWVTDDNSIDNYGVQVYANYYATKQLFFNGYAGYNYGDNDMKRFVPGPNLWQEQKNHTNSYWIGGNVGYDFNFASGFTVTPAVGLEYQYVRGSAFFSPGPFPMHVGKATNKALLLPVDLTVEYKHRIDDCSAISFRLKGGYAYDFKNDGASGSAAWDFAGALPVSLQGFKPGHHSWNVAAGIRYEYKRFDIGVNYRYDGRSKYNAHRIAGTIGVNF